MKGDLVSILEAAYAVDLPEQEWLTQIVGAAKSLSDGLGVCGYLYDLGARPMSAWAYVNLGTPIDPSMLATTLATASEDYIENAWKRIPCGTASDTPGYDEQPAVKMFFEPLGVKDMLGVNAYDPSGIGIWLGAPLSKRTTLKARDRAMLSRVAAHLGASFRLRRRLERQPEAVLSPNGKLEHATGEATSTEAREALRDAVRAMQKSRGTLRKKPEEAVANWRALTHARWSLVEEIEQSGDRYIVAKTNDPIASGPDSLAPREKQVATYAALGHTNNFIAYELGLASSTVRVLLARATKKLGVKTREELVERLRRHACER